MSPATTSATVSDASIWSPRTGITFNNPRGTRTQQLALVTQVNLAIDAAPKGSVIRMAQYRFDVSNTAARLVAVHRCGVGVKFLIDDASLTRQVVMLRKALGADERKRSFVTTCERSCMSTTVPTTSGPPSAGTASCTSIPVRRGSGPTPSCCSTCSTRCPAPASPAATAVLEAGGDVGYLRQKFGADTIRTVRGIGYRFTA